MTIRPPPRRRGPAVPEPRRTRRSAGRRPARRPAPAPPDAPSILKMARPRTSSISPGDTTAHWRLPVMLRSAWDIAAVKKIRPANMIETKRRLLDSDDSASMVNAESSACDQGEQGDRRQQEQVRAQEGEAAAEQHLDQQQHHRRRQRHAEQEDQHGDQLAGDVLDAGQRLRQVDLQRVGAPVVGNQPGHRDGDQEDEDRLEAEEVAVGAVTSPAAPVPARRSTTRRSGRRGRRTAPTTAAAG